MVKRGYGDTYPDTQEPANTIGGFGTGGTALRSIRTPSTGERAKARRYLERVAPDLIDMLGLA
jgi:hypothetical protein